MINLNFIVVKRPQVSLASMIMIMVLERRQNLLHCQIYHNGTKDKHVGTRQAHGSP